VMTEGRRERRDDDGAVVARRARALCRFSPPGEPTRKTTTTNKHLFLLYLLTTLTQQAPRGRRPSVLHNVLDLLSPFSAARGRVGGAAGVLSGGARSDRGALEQRAALSPQPLHNNSPACSSPASACSRLNKRSLRSYTQTRAPSLCVEQPHQALPSETLARALLLFLPCSSATRGCAPAARRRARAQLRC